MRGPRLKVSICAHTASLPAVWPDESNAYSDDNNDDDDDDDDDNDSKSAVVARTVAAFAAAVVPVATALWAAFAVFLLALWA